MLIDGGPKGTWRGSLLPRLSAATDPVTSLDVVCVTHTDDDHIQGIVDLLRQNIDAVHDHQPMPYEIGEVWFNFPSSSGVAPEMDALERAAFAASIKQGNELAAMTRRLSIPQRGTELVPGWGLEIDGMFVTVLAPPIYAVERLASKWQPTAKLASVTKHSTHYADRSVYNAASLAFHIQYGTATLLVSGDSLGQTILDGLNCVPHLSACDPLKVSVLTVPHHGSAASVRKDFFERIQADTYVLSSDGGMKHGHPNPEVLRWIVETRDPSDSFRLAFTNEPIASTSKILEELRHGRSFEVVTRNPAMPSIVAYAG